MQDPEASDAVYSDYSAIAAELYDALRGDDALAGEYDFHARVLSAIPGPHLELACGTGRILLRLIAAGIDVEGLDNSPDMLAICRRKALARGLSPVLHQQSMEAMELPRRYGALFAPLASMMLLDDATFDAALQACHRQLRSGGRLFFSVYPQPAEPVFSPWRDLGEIAHDGAAVRVSHQCERGFREGVLVESFRFHRPAQGAILGTHRITLYFRAPETIVAMLAARGFDAVAVMGDHRDDPPSRDNRILLFDTTRA